MKSWFLGAAIVVAICSTQAFATEEAMRLPPDQAWWVATQSPSIPNRVAAIQSLGMRKYTPAVSSLVELCYDPSREIRLAAITSLRLMKAPEALDTFYFIIWDQSNSFTTWDKMAAVSAMGDYPNINVWSLINVVNVHPDFRVRLTAARSLQNRTEWEAQWAAYPWRSLLARIYPHGSIR